MIARHGSKEQKAKLGPIARLPRPWALHTCPPSLLSTLLLWLDDVAGWINHDYSWRVARPIPACWPAHPHIVHELAVLAWLRVVADEALDVGPLEDWQRYALPSFASRLAERLGDSCGSGHDDWPGGSRHGGYRSEAAVEARQQAFAGVVEQQRRGAPHQVELDLAEDPIDEEPLFDDPEVPE